MHTGAMRRRLRVLCTSTGGAGHVHAVAPVARALRDRGHDVRWAVAADGGDAVGAMGFEWSAAGLTTRLAATRPLRNWAGSCSSRWKNATGREEEWHHHRYVVRDLDVIDTRRA